jgi:hypothetical protein
MHLADACILTKHRECIYSYQASCIIYSYIAKVKVTLHMTVSQSLCQGIELILGLMTSYYFLCEGCFLKFAVALSDERSGLSFLVYGFVTMVY